MFGRADKLHLLLVVSVLSIFILAGCDIKLNTSGKGGFTDDACASSSDPAACSAGQDPALPPPDDEGLPPEDDPNAFATSEHCPAPCELRQASAAVDMEPRESLFVYMQTQDRGLSQPCGYAHEDDAGWPHCCCPRICTPGEVYDPIRGCIPSDTCGGLPYDSTTQKCCPDDPDYPCDSSEICVNGADNEIGDNPFCGECNSNAECEASYGDQTGDNVVSWVCLNHICAGSYVGTFDSSCKMENGNCIGFCGVTAPRVTSQSGEIVGKISKCVDFSGGCTCPMSTG
tara:strand:+ start:15 stop:872 length:858 start_codon:yes stop_codon:yes gene_type:complete